jgi:hypothetical protein
MTNLEITDFNVVSNDDVNIVTQYFPLGKWSNGPCYVLMISTGDGEMLVLTLGSKKVSKMIVDALDKLNRKSFLHNNNMHTCVID